MSNETSDQFEFGAKLSASQQAVMEAYRKPAYRYFVLGLLTIVYVFNFIDRQIINVLAAYIIEDLQLSDGQFGMLSGLAFAVIYTTLGIPIARWADLGNRRNIIALAVTVWSAMTVLCGAAQNFLQLFLARFGVGVGEAGGSPPAHSIVSDIFPAEQRATALSIYSLGVYGGILVSTVGGAYLVEMFDWRTAFVVVGLPGLLLAVLVRGLVKEPLRGMAEARRDAQPPSFFQVLGFLWQRKSFRHLSFACALHAFVTYGMGNFMPLFLGRVHGMPIIDIGWYYGLVAGIGGLAGTYFGGWVSDRMAKRTGGQNLVHLDSLHLHRNRHSLRAQHLAVDAQRLYRHLLLSAAGILWRLVPGALPGFNPVPGGPAHARHGHRGAVVRAQPDRPRPRSDDDRIRQRLPDALLRQRRLALRHGDHGLGQCLVRRPLLLERPHHQSRFRKRPAVTGG